MNRSCTVHMHRFLDHCMDLMPSFPCRRSHRRPPVPRECPWDTTRLSNSDLLIQLRSFVSSFASFLFFAAPSPLCSCVSSSCPGLGSFHTTCQNTSHVLRNRTDDNYCTRKSPGSSIFLPSEDSCSSRHFRYTHNPPLSTRVCTHTCCKRTGRGRVPNSRARGSYCKGS